MQPPKNGNSGHLKPTGKPIYAANEKELQKKIKNRQSALESRRKNKEKFERLEKTVEKLEDERQRLLNENRRLKAMVEPKLESMDDASEQCDDVILVENDQSDETLIDGQNNQKTFDFSVSNLSKSEPRNQISQPIRAIQPRQIKPIGIEHHFPIQPTVQEIPHFKQPHPVQPTQNVIHQSFVNYNGNSQPRYHQPTYHHQHGYTNQNTSFMEMMTNPIENPQRNPMMLPDQGSDFDSFLNNLMQL